MEKAANTYHSLVLQNQQLRVGLATFGGRLTAIQTVDRRGDFDHVLLGFDEPSQYARAASVGGLLGRYANRIGFGQFSLDGQQYQLSRNEGVNTLHGGALGFHRVEWEVVAQSPTEVIFQFISPDGDQGFPGTLTARAAYRIDGPTLWLELTATTTRPTVVNLSTHPYFNLGGLTCRDIGDHQLTVFADTYLPTDAAQIPTGEICDVGGTEFDFRRPVLLRDRLNCQLDHCFVVGAPASTPHLAARLYHPGSGRSLEVFTTQPGLQVYNAFKFNGTLPGRGGAYQKWAGLALEPQQFPDAPNKPHFPSTVLRPGETLRLRNGFCFGVSDVAA